MAAFELSAPGKVILTGEYAVLWGAPAAVAGVAPRMHATLLSRADTAVTLHVPGAEVEGRIGGDGIQWSASPPEARFAQRALELARPSSGLVLTIAAAPTSDGRKLGLGSSASASAIAAAAGLHARGAEVTPEAVFELAARAHFELQGGRGSNVDVAASCWGGILRYFRGPPARSEPVRAPGLQLGMAFSGVSASTPSMVTAVESALGEAGRARFVAASTDRTEAFLHAAMRGEAAAALAALNASGDLLAELGAATGVPVLTRELEELQTFGRARGLGAKVSGAGGGDSLLLASFDPAALDAALEELRRSGRHAMRLEPTTGIRISASA